MESLKKLIDKNWVSLFVHPRQTREDKEAIRILREARFYVNPIISSYPSEELPQARNQKKLYIGLEGINELAKRTDQALSN